MSDKKLTPRVGDRVIVAPGRIEDYTTIGRVIGAGEGVQKWLVVLDHDNEGYWFPDAELTVVDRDPVEWPEGWEFDELNHILGTMAYHEPTNLALTKTMLASLLATGPDMLARWDELVGEA